MYQFTDGNLAVNPLNIAKVDVHISIAPTTRLLLNYGRIKSGKAALTGKMLAWGRRGGPSVGRFASAKDDKRR